MANTKNEEQEGQLDQIEEVDKQLGKTELFLEENQNNILIGIGVVVLIIVGVWFYFNNIKGPKEQEAASQMHMAEIYLENDSINLALNGDGNYPGFLSIIDSYSGTPAANNAKFYSAVCYMRTGQFDQAIKMLDGFSSSDPMIEPESIGLLGDAYMEKGDIAKAESLYKKAADKADGNILLAPIYLKKLATAFEKEQKFADALSAYEKIKSNYPSSSEGSNAEKHIQDMKIKLAK